MDEVKRKKASFVWDPRRSGLFVLGLGGAVRLYAWDDRVRPSLLLPGRLVSPWNADRGFSLFAAVAPGSLASD
jgi:hypothetical protein